MNSKTSTSDAGPLLLTVESMTWLPSPEFTSNASSRFQSVDGLLSEIETTYESRTVAA